MRITLGTFILADHGITGPSGMKISGARAVQVVQYLRGEAVEVIPRGNRQTTITFSVARQHATELDAEIYVAEHEILVPEDGLLTITTGARGPQRSIFLPRAVLVSNDSSYVGITTLHNYQIQGGKFTRVRPITP